MNWLSNVDWTVSFSNIVQMIVMTATVASIFYAMRWEVRLLSHDVKAIEKRLESLAESFKQLGMILTQMAVQENRLNMIERSIENIKDGHGYAKKQKES